MVTGGGASAGGANLATNDGSGNASGTASGSRASGAAAVAGNSSNVDRDSFSRWRDRQYYGPRRWYQSSREDPQWEKDTGKCKTNLCHSTSTDGRILFPFFSVSRGADTKKKDATSGLPLWISDDLELWPEKDTPLRFTQIAALHSEFIAISTKGELHQWRWADTEPYRNHENPSIFHPKTQSLNLIYEKVTHISATSIRCTVSTESNRVATWMDELLGMTGSKLEHSAINFPELQCEKIVSLYTCTLYTVARTENSNLYWWGVLPFGQRKRLWDKHKAKSKKPIRSSVSAGELTVGAQVCMKNSPMYQPGAIGFTISNGVPKVGQLMNAAWDLTDICRFKIVQSSASGNASSASSLTSSDLKDLVKAASSSGGGASTVTAGASTAAASKTSSGNNKETADRLDMPPPPSPASSTCSDTGSVTSHKRAKRAAPKEENDAKKDEEQWMLK